MSSAITRINPETLPDSTKIGYSQISIVESGRIAHVSGQVASQGDAPIPDSLIEQTKRVTANLQAVLDSLAAGTDDIVLLRIYVVDLNDTTMNQSFPIVLEWLNGAQPSITGIGVTALAGASLKLEIEMAVRLPE